MPPDWFRPRGYRHFDRAVGASFAAKVMEPGFVKRHSWSPLISCVKREKRYKPDLRRTVFKDRSIMYASHRDACILSRYAHEVTARLDERYSQHGLDGAVIAYRKLGKANYDFAAAALAFARQHQPCVILCFDVTGFFDNLDHKLLKAQLLALLGCKELPDDWYSVFKAVTKYRHVPLDGLKAHRMIGARIKQRSREPIATMAELDCAKVQIIKHNAHAGIPQGTPISAAFSNLYMWETDLAIVQACAAAGGLYQRYSDDILIVCPIHAEKDLSDRLIAAIASQKLEISAAKTDRAVFDPSDPRVIQYLGFNLSPDGAVIRPNSLAKQWRKVRRSLRRTQKTGATAVSSGKSSKIFTRKLRQRFLPSGIRNFSSYARRAAKTMKSKRIVGQVRRLERMVEQAIRDLNK